MTTSSKGSLAATVRRDVAKYGKPIKAAIIKVE